MANSANRLQFTLQQIIRTVDLVMVRYCRQLETCSKLLSPLVSVQKDWRQEEALQGTPLEFYTKEDLLNDTTTLWKHSFGQKYEYAMVVDVTEYRTHTAKATKVRGLMLSGKNGRSQFYT
jgi:hypothetical protein